MVRSPNEWKNSRVWRKNRNQKKCCLLKAWSFIWTRSNRLYPKMLTFSDKFGWYYSIASGEETKNVKKYTRRWQRRRTMNKAQVKNVINVPVFHYFPISSLQKSDYVPNPTKVRPLFTLLHLCDSENRGLTLVRLLCVKFGWIGSLVMERKKFLFSSSSSSSSSSFIIILTLVVKCTGIHSSTHIYMYTPNVT